MKIGVLIITRGDRQKFLDHAKYLLSKQTRQPDCIEIVDDKPLSEKIDITYRYRIGCERLFKKGVDVIIFWEDDDWYRSDYIDLMISLWKVNGKPDILGQENTTYYHIGINKYIQMNHKGRSSAFSSMITPYVMNFDFGKDSEPFFDIQLWKMNGLKKSTFIHKEIICMGIKHGVGNCGGKAHSKSFPYNKDDNDLSFLRETVDEESFNFYTNI